jgi:predicted AAA+ superfamily ATPase
MGYLEFLEKTYVIFRLPAFAGLDKAAVLGKKLYFCDNGIVSTLSQPGEGALFENAIFNQLRGYGELAYLSKGHEYEVDFILTRPGELGKSIGLEVKYHPIEADNQKLKRIESKHGLIASWIVGRYSTPGFHDFIWGGSIF